MNWMVRNFAALLLGALTSALTVSILLFCEARDGQTLFSYNGQTLTMIPFLAIVPIGPVLAGLAGALGYLAGGMILRLRPAAIALFVVVIVSGGLVYAAQSAEFALYIVGWPQPNGGPTKDMRTFSKFIWTSVTNSPLHLWSPDYNSYESEEQASFFSSAPPPSDSGPVLGPSGDSRVDGLSGGVSGMMSSQDMSQSGPGKQLNQMGEGFAAFRARVRANSGQWIKMGFQTVGLAFGGLLVMIYLRRHAYCEGCMLLLKKKGSRTRFYSRTRDMRAAVDDVLVKARDKQLQQAIHAHVAKGADRDGNWSEYCSTVELRRCPQCRIHEIRFRTRRKHGEQWKDIALLGFSATSLEQLDFA
jgi:hypothetical protein